MTEIIEPTNAEIEGVATVLEKAAEDPIARSSGYIMAKMLKRVFVPNEQSRMTKERLIQALMGLVCAMEPRNIHTLAIRGSYSDTLSDDELINLIECEINERI